MECVPDQDMDSESEAGCDGVTYVSVGVGVIIMTRSTRRWRQRFGCCMIRAIRAFRKVLEQQRTNLERSSAI